MSDSPRGHPESQSYFRSRSKTQIKLDFHVQPGSFFFQALHVVGLWEKKSSSGGSSLT